MDGGVISTRCTLNSIKKSTPDKILFVECDEHVPGSQFLGFGSVWLFGPERC